MKNNLARLLPAVQREVREYEARRRDADVQAPAAGPLDRLTRVKAVMSAINAMMVRVRNRDELFIETCRIAVEDGQFRMALDRGGRNAGGRASNRSRNARCRQRSKPDPRRRISNAAGHRRAIPFSRALQPAREREVQRHRGRSSGLASQPNPPPPHTSEGH
jgi:hypothetical protein